MKLTLKILPTFKLQHPQINSHYVMSVNFGDKGVSPVVSGVAQILKAEDLKDHLGIFLCNSMPITLKGVESKAMLLCAFEKYVHMDWYILNWVIHLLAFKT